MIQFFLILFSLIFLPVFSAKAICPVCTIAVGVGLGLSRWLGIDDLISGVWIGGLIVSMSLWFLDWLNGKRINFKLLWLFVFVAFYAVILVPLFLTDVIGHPLNKFLGIDRLIFGIIFGSLVFVISFFLHIYLKKKNQGKSYFPFQKVVIPLSFLLITSFVFYLILRFLK